MGLREDAPENKMNKPAIMVRKVWGTHSEHNVLPEP